MAQSEKLEFANDQGIKLAGRLELPDGKPAAMAIFAHCFTCSKDIAAASRISRALAERGYGVLRFDFTGLGNSDGDFANTNFSSNVQDLVAAANYLAEHHESPALLVGHSLGGAAVLSAAGVINSVKAVATIGAPYDPAHVIENFAADRATIESEGEAEVKLAGRPFKIKKQFIDDLEAQNAGKTLSELRVASLVFHSPIDNTVSVDNARQIYEQLRHPKSFVSLDQADHLLQKRVDSDFVASTLATWSARYLPQPDQSKEPNRPKLEEGEVAVVEWDQSLSQKVFAGAHSFTADEPVRLGGHDKGPTPYDFLLTALGTCTSMTLRMYANHKKIPLTGVEVILNHGREHAADSANSDNQNAKIDVISRRLKISGELTNEQRQRLLEIADRCPVHRTLMNEKRIDTELV